MSQIIQIRRGTAALWTSTNPTLAQGEMGIETDTDKVKVGDGTTAWTSLTYGFGTMPVNGGGTGAVTIAAKSVWVANSTDTIVSITPSAGQSIRINAGNTAWEAYTPGASTGITWSEVTGTTQAATVNSAYIVNNAALVTVTIPDTAAVGDIVRVTGKGAGGWRVAQNASEQILMDNGSTTVGVGGSISSTGRYNGVELVCITANTTWAAYPQSSGGLTIV